MRDEFKSHTLNTEGLRKAADLAEVFSEALDKLEKLGLKPSRGWSLAVTKLEEASYHLKRQLALDPANQTKDA